MKLPPDSVIEERLVKTFPNTRLREQARATGLIQRDGGKLKADALFWALAIGFLSGNYRTLEEFRQEYIDTFGGSLEYSSFHDWFTPALCEFLREPTTVWGGGFVGIVNNAVGEFGTLLAEGYFVPHITRQHPNTTEFPISPAAVYRFNKASEIQIFL